MEIDRRSFLAAAATIGAGVSADAAAAPAAEGWEWETMRWMQICATEDDPSNYDPQFWLDFLRRTQTQGVCLSAGGVTAFYPTKVPFHYRSPYLGDGDMFGDLAKACKAMGLRVLARVDPHAMRADALAAHPEWVARDTAGAPKPHPTDPELFLTCPNGAVTFEWMPAILREIVANYPVDGVFGNRWAGGAGMCHCATCNDSFRKASGFAVPATLGNVRDPAVRAYLRWDDAQRYAQIERWNAAVRAVNPATFFTPGTWGRLDPARLRGTIRSLYADRQGRNVRDPIWVNGRSAKETQCLMPDRPMSGIFAVGATSTGYRHVDSTQSDAEIATYLHDGLAQGFRPWMTKFKAEIFDRRWVPVVEKAYAWHARHEAYFRNTANLATVAMLRSVQTNTYYAPGALSDGSASGSANTAISNHRTDEPATGFYQALLESRIPFAFVDERRLDAAALAPYRVIVLPNIAALSDAQAAQLRNYVARGGAIVATHETSLYDEWGQRRANFALADLFGCDFAGSIEERVQNGYLLVNGVHALTRGFDDTPRIMGGTRSVNVMPRSGVSGVPLTIAPRYPDLPMEKAYPRSRDSNVPAVYARAFGKGRVVYLPENIDATFWQCSSGDHLSLLRNAVDWAMNADAPLTVRGAGLIDVSYWRQARSVAAHIVNLNSPMAMGGGYLREITPIGPQDVTFQLPADAKVKAVRLLESETEVAARVEAGILKVRVPGVRLHEIVAVDLV
ncbi:beta-galactosidase trimerization domain-containing protein [Sphingomonas sp. ASY06-1R]|uniref:beta-galactosidase trimerization domain-containing protein n=1 Tax=Sphingomonas sp. ASY06-1R TaxID=3445771 RepID=UPI003FA24046